MLENSKMLESLSGSPRDPFSALWWTDSSFDRSSCRNSTFARVDWNYSRRLMESDGRRSEQELSLDGARKKLTWISREDDKSDSEGTLVGNDRQSIQNEFVHGRSARFGGTVSPRRGIHNHGESPLRRGESVRSIRTPSIDATVVPGRGTVSRRLRSANHASRPTSFKEGSGSATAAVANGDHNEAKEASAISKGLTSTHVFRDQRTASKPRVPHPTTPPTTDEFSAVIFPSRVDSPESDRMVVSYLAEETDRIIKARNQKLKLRACDSNVVDKPLISNQGRSSAEEAMTTVSSGRQLPRSRPFDKTKVESVSPIYEHVDRDQVGVGDCQLDKESSNSPASRMSGSPSLSVYKLLPQYVASRSVGEGKALPPIGTISQTMENYLYNLRTGSNMGPQIIVGPRQGGSQIFSPAPLAPSNIAVLKSVVDERENRSARLSRRESYTALSRAALSPINGNEDVTHPTAPLSQRKAKLYGYGELPIAGEDPSNRGSERKQTTDLPKSPRNLTNSVQKMQQDGTDSFPSRLQYWVDFLGNGADITCKESPLHHLTQESEERTSAAGRKELGKKIPPVPVSRGPQSSEQERRPIGGSARHPVAARRLLGQSERYDPEVGKSMLSDRVLRVGMRDKHNASRRTQSCRRDSVVRSLLDSSEEYEPRPRAGTRNTEWALPSEHSIYSNPQNSTRSSVKMRVSSPRDILPKPTPFLSQIETQKFYFSDSSDQESSVRTPEGPESGATLSSSSRKMSVTGPFESGGNALSLSSRRFSVAGHESGGNSSRKLPVAGHEAAGWNPLSSSRGHLLAPSPESGRTSLVGYYEPPRGAITSVQKEIDKTKYRRMDASSQNKFGDPDMDSPILDSQLNMKNAQWLDLPSMYGKSSVSLDKQDVHTRLFAQTKDDRGGHSITTSVRHPCSMPSRMIAIKPQPPSAPGSSLHRRLANQLKLGSKAKSSSTGKDGDALEEPKPRKMSPWRTKSAEILQSLTRKKGSSTHPPAVPPVDAGSLPNSEQENSFNSDTCQSPMRTSDPWHHRMMHSESGNTPLHRKSYMLPSISNISPVHAKSFQSQLRSRPSD